MFYSINFLRLLFYGIIALMIVLLAARSLRNLRMILGIPKRMPTDVSQLAIPPSALALNSIMYLQSIGFQRLGEAQVNLPGRKPVAYYILVNPDRTIQAEVADSLVSFSTHFGEKTLVVTDCPKGENINTPAYQSHTITTNLGDAYFYHKQQSEKFKTKYGEPAAISDMADYLRWEKIGRENYGITKLKRFLVMDWINIALCIFGVAILAGLVVTRYLLPSLETRSFSLEAIELIGIALLLPILFVPGILSYLTVNGSKRDSRTIRK